MSAVTFNTRHSRTGLLQRLTEGQIAAVNRNSLVLEIVADDAKPFEPGMFKPGHVGEFANPEPETDAVAAAQDAYDLLLADGHAPNSGVVKAAKAELVAAQEAADAEAKAAAELTQQIQDGESIASDTEGAPQ